MRSFPVRRTGKQGPKKGTKTSSSTGRRRAKQGGSQVAAPLLKTRLRASNAAGIGQPHSAKRVLRVLRLPAPGRLKIPKAPRLKVSVLCLSIGRQPEKDKRRRALLKPVVFRLRRADDETRRKPSLAERLQAYAARQSASLSKREAAQQKADIAEQHRQARAGLTENRRKAKEGANAARQLAIKQAEAAEVERPPSRPRVANKRWKP